MLDRRIFEKEYISAIRDKSHNDPALIERTIYAFGLLEALRTTGMPFIFKGGTSLMLVLKHPMRLSTDVDLLVKPGTDVDDYIRRASRVFPFEYCEEQHRNGKNSIQKKHYKFYYTSPVTGRPFHIILDVVFEDSPYFKLSEREIKNDMLLVDGTPITVTVPTLEGLLGDKMTAFAPHTIGIPFGVDKELEIAKQLYDIATLQTEAVDFECVRNTYYVSAANEISFRGLSITPEDALEDGFQAALCVASKGKLNHEEYALYLKGITRLRGHIFSGTFTGETAAEQAAQVMHLNACIKANENSLILPNLPKDQLLPTIDAEYRQLSYLRRLNPNAYAHVLEALRLRKMQNR